MCTSPRIIITYGKNNEGKYITLFKGWTPDLEKFCVENKYKFYKVGCGRCIECRLEYAKKWANRLELQKKVSENAYFLTLTYNDMNLKDKNGGYSMLSGKNNSVIKKDVQDFLKRLRWYNEGKKLVYFCCAEYGDNTFRPHYHMIVFNLAINDFSEFFPFIKDKKLCYTTLKSKSGEKLYYSKKLEEIWKNGNVQVSVATWNTMRYVAGYVTKKQYGDTSIIYEKLGINAPFLLMSQGIAGDYFEKYKNDIYRDDAIYLVRDGVAKRYKPPRYFDRKLEESDPQWLEMIKNKRESDLSFDSLDVLKKSEKRLIEDVIGNRCIKNILNKKIKRDII